MNLRQHIMLAGYQDHYETFQVVTPIPTAHPPYLKNPIRVKQDTAQDGWHKKDSKKKKKRARKDLKEILRKTLNQGRHVMVRHSHGGDPGLWNPSAIADL